VLQQPATFPPPPRRSHALRARRLPVSPHRLTSEDSEMASIAGSALSFARPVKAINTSSVSFSAPRKGNAFLRLHPVPKRFAICCAAKKDTVDKVEIVMGLEEEFGISVEESSAQSIATVEDAAELIDKLVDAKSP
ncbi:unnamed protein product, partial [Urochloa humidicola]